MVRGAGGVRAVRIAQHGGRKVRLVVDTEPRPTGWTGRFCGMDWVSEGRVHEGGLRTPNGAVEASAALHPLRGLVIGIDPGHGGGDPGAVAPSGLTEKEANLKIALRLRRLLNREGARTLMTRSDDRRLPVASRIAFVSGAGADLIISVHCDALDGSPHYTGVTSYYHGGSRRSQALAEALQEYLAAATGLPDRGARPDTTCHHSGFYVLRNATCPAVLVETGYLTSTNTAARLRERGFRDRIARGIAAGLRHYLNAAPVRTARR